MIYQQLDMEKYRINNKKLLVARNNKGYRYRKICRWIWYVLKNEKLYRNTGGETDGI